MVMVLDDGDRSFILAVSIHCSTDEMGVEEAFWNMLGERVFDALSVSEGRGGKAVHLL